MTPGDKAAFLGTAIALVVCFTAVASYIGARRGRRDMAVKLQAIHSAELNDTTKRLDDHLKWASSERTNIHEDVSEVREKVLIIESGQHHLSEQVRKVVEAVDENAKVMNQLIGEFRRDRSRGRS